MWSAVRRTEDVVSARSSERIAVVTSWTSLAKLLVEREVSFVRERNHNGRMRVTQCYLPG